MRVQAPVPGDFDCRVWDSGKGMKLTCHPDSLSSCQIVPKIVSQTPCVFHRPFLYPNPSRREKGEVQTQAGTRPNPGPASGEEVDICIIMISVIIVLSVLIYNPCMFAFLLLFSFAI